MTISEERFTALEESVAKLHAALPALFAFRDNFELWAKETGVFDHLVQDVLSRVSKTSAPVVTVPAIPVAAQTGLTMPGLSASQIVDLGATMTRAVSLGFVTAGVRDAVKAGLLSGIYPEANAEIIGAVKLWRYEAPDQGVTISPVEDAVLDAYLHIIDQRDLPDNPNVTMSPTDSRWKHVSASAASVPVSQGSATVVYTENVVMVNPDTGFTISLGMSKNDDGLSVLYNYKYPWANGATSVPTKPQMLLRLEQDGGVSINGTAPQQKEDGSPVERTPWDGLKGKDIIFYPNGYNRDGMGKAKSADIACMQAGRTLRLGASSETAKPTFPVEITPDGASVNGRPL